MVSPILKPSWQNLKGGGAARTPVEEIVGQCYDWKVEPTQWGSNNIVLSFNQCQILKSDTPFPYAEWNLTIKWSDTVSSGWGIFGQSAAEKLGVDIELLDIDLLKGRWMHLLRTFKEFGDDRNAAPLPDGTQPKISGFVWQIVQFIQPGQTVQSVAQGTPVPQVNPVVQAMVSNPNGPQPVAVPAVAVSPVQAAPVQVVSTIVAPVTPVAVVQPAGAGITADERAMTLLHGKDTASFFQVAIPDQIIRTDANLINSILSNAFITAKIASGEVIRNDDGTHTVVGM